MLSLPNPKNLPHNQHGTVLAVSLIILVLLTLLGLTGMQATTLEGRITMNLRDKQSAFQAAETTLKQGEDKVRQLSDQSATQKGLTCLPQRNTDGLFAPDEEPDLDKVWNSQDVLIGDSIEAIDKFSTKFIIQCLPGQEGLYRITAFSRGKHTDAVVILQSVYQYQLNS